MHTVSNCWKKWTLTKIFELEQWNQRVKRFLFTKKVISLSVCFMPPLQRSKPTAGWNPMKCQSDTQNRKYTSSTSTFWCLAHIHICATMRTYICATPVYESTFIRWLGWWHLFICATVWINLLLLELRSAQCNFQFINFYFESETFNNSSKKCYTLVSLVSK